MCRVEFYKLLAFPYFSLSPYPFFLPSSPDWIPSSVFASIFDCSLHISLCSSVFRFLGCSQLIAQSKQKRVRIWQRDGGDNSSSKKQRDCEGRGERKRAAGIRMKEYKEMKEEKEWEVSHALIPVRIFQSLRLFSHSSLVPAVSSF